MLTLKVKTRRPSNNLFEVNFNFKETQNQSNKTYYNLQWKMNWYYRRLLIVILFSVVKMNSKLKLQKISSSWIASYVLHLLAIIAATASYIYCPICRLQRTNDWGRHFLFVGVYFGLVFFICCFFFLIGKRKSLACDFSLLVHNVLLVGLHSRITIVGMPSNTGISVLLFCLLCGL